ncbi:A24 family peptidase [Dyella japonica]|jgi:prepilin peptidase CpaA|uniref:Prepilin peptidase CpaA n=1 Tax=Dyella japonica TaxID=231455 RepID=A0ABV2K0T1_9GAMM
MLAIVLGACVVLSDVYARRVPNAWLVATLLTAIAMAFLQKLSGASQVSWPSPLGLATGLISMLPFYAIRWMGAGDVKFFATLGFLLGARALLPIWVMGCLMTGVHATCVLLLRMPRIACAPGIVSVHQHLRAWPLWRRAQHARQGRVGLPHAAYLAIAAIVTVLAPELTQWGRP